MPYCERCGAEIDEEATYCPKCGYPVSGKELGYVELATWGQRFIAFIIDWVILGVILGALGFSAFGFAFRIGVGFVASRILPFLYFMLLDFYYGQTLGRRIMHIRITRVGGGNITMFEAAIESFGKTFLLPIDVIVGIFFYTRRNQRLFNYLSDTVVVEE